MSQDKEIVNGRPIRIVLAEDHHVVRRALRAVFRNANDLEVVGEVADGLSLIETVRACRPDLLLMDVKMPNFNARKVVPELRAALPDLRILVLTGQKSSAYVFGLMRSGVDGYMLKDDPEDVLLDGVRAVAHGDEWMSREAAALLARHVRENGSGGAPLTEREREVLVLLVAGHQNEEIATRLNLSSNTVRNYLSEVYRKLHVSSRVEAAVYALRHGLVSDEELNG